MQRRSKASIAFLPIVLMIFALIVSSFLFVGYVDACGRHRPPHPPHPPRPPLAKYIHIGIFCEDTGAKVPDGLAVECVGPYGYHVITYTSKGYAIFGSGVADGTYTVSWYWNGLYTYNVTIDCSKITWEFDYTVPNPTITKHFRYDTDWGEHPPVKGLEVSLYDGDTFITSFETDDTGTVFFDGHYVAVCHDYYLKWLWAGELQSEGPIHFQYTEDGKLETCSWEDTNDLQAKSGGGINLHLAEERG